MRKLLFLLLPIICFGQNNSVSTSPMKGFHISSDYSLMRKPTNEMSGFPTSNWGDVFVVDGVPFNGLRAWFNPAVNITLSTGVSVWGDITNTYFLRQPTGALQPTYNTGDRPSIAFTSTVSLLSDTVAFGIGTGSALTVMFIGKNTNNSTRVFMSFNATNQTTCDSGGWAYTIANSAGAVANAINVGFPPTVISGSQATTATTVNLSLCSFEINRTDAKVYFNSNSQFHKSNFAITYTTADNWANGNLLIGVNKDGSATSLAGTCYDILIWNRALTSIEYASVYRFFKSKYALVN